MLKKALIASAVFAATTGMALANGGFVAPPPHHTGGFYAGATISRDLGNWEVKAPGGASFENLGGEGIDGTILAGYGLTFQDRYTLALEGWGKISSLKWKATAGAANVKLEREWAAGVRLLPGIKVTDSTTLSAIIGWEYSEFELRAFAPAAGFNFKQDRGRNGIQLGLRMEAMVTQNVGILGQWTWAKFENFNVANTQIKIEPVVDQFEFGLTYHFNVA